MKFLVDRCVGKRLTDWLRQQGHDVLESSKLGPDPGDRVLLEIAAKEKRVLITIDTDFGVFVFQEGLNHAGIVRLPDVPSDRGNRIRVSQSPGR